MRIFEFSFNPKKRKDRFFQVFSYEPKSPKEKSKGSLYIVGELNNALEFNSRFLKRLAETIQNEYYSSSQKTAASALKAALKKANMFLTQESKKGNVDWLGNLHLAVLLFITVKAKKTMFHFTKTGSIKISLVRQGMIVDVGKNLESSSRQPGKVFENLVSGGLMPNDSVTAASKEIFDVLSREKSLGGIGALKEAKEFRDFFLKRQRMLSLSSGVLVSFVIEEEEAKRSPINKSLLPSLPRPRLMLPKGIKFNLPKLNLKFFRLRRQVWIPRPTSPLAQSKAGGRHPSAIKKQAILILLLAGLLLLGYLLF